MKKLSILKKVFLFTFFFSSAGYSQAQTASESSGDSRLLRLGIGLNVGTSTDNAYGLTLGGDIRLQKDFISNMSGTLTAGYTNFAVDEEQGGGSIGYLPLKAGIKLFPIANFYLSGEVGPAFGLSNRRDVIFGDKVALAYSPGVGVALNTGWDFGFRYEGLSQEGSNLGQLALRIAYGFKLK